MYSLHTQYKLEGPGNHLELSMCSVVCLHKAVHPGGARLTVQVGGTGEPLGVIYVFSCVFTQGSASWGGGQAHSTSWRHRGTTWSYPCVQSCVYTRQCILGGGRLTVQVGGTGEPLGVIYVFSRVFTQGSASWGGQAHSTSWRDRGTTWSYPCVQSCVYTRQCILGGGRLTVQVGGTGEPLGVIHVFSRVFTQGSASWGGQAHSTSWRDRGTTWSYPCVQSCVYTRQCILGGPGSQYKLEGPGNHLELSMCSVVCLHKAVHPGGTRLTVQVMMGIPVIKVQFNKAILCHKNLPFFHKS